MLALDTVSLSLDYLGARYGLEDVMRNIAYQPIHGSAYSLSFFYKRRSSIEQAIPSSFPANFKGVVWGEQA
jgi:hypothetical protein